MKFVHFTSPDGKDVAIVADEVVGLKPNDGSYHPAARTVIVLVSGVQAVRESEAEVESWLEAD